MSSMPAEMRIRLSDRPMAARRSGGTEAWVIDAGWQTSVSTPPRLSASAISRKRLSARRACFERRDLERQHAAEAVRHLPPRELVLRMVRQARVEDLRHLRVPAKELRQRQAVAECCAIRSGQRLGAAQHQPRVERAQDRAGRVLDELQPFDVLVADGDDDAADRVAVAVEVLRRAVDDQVGAERRAAAAGTDSRTCCRRRRSRRGDARSPTTAAMSVSRMTGLVGVSRNTSFVPA